MKELRLLLLRVLAFVLAATAAGPVRGELRSTQARSVAMVRLLANPEDFEGKVIQVTGVLLFSNHLLCLSTEHARVRDRGHCVGLEFRGRTSWSLEGEEWDLLRGWSGEHVRLEGTAQHRRGLMSEVTLQEVRWVVRFPLEPLGKAWEPRSEKAEASAVVTEPHRTADQIETELYERPEDGGVVDALELGIRLYDAGKAARALPFFERVIRDAPSNPAGYFYRALCYVAAGDNAAAKKDLEMVLEIDSGGTYSADVQELMPFVDEP